MSQTPVCVARFSELSDRSPTYALVAGVDLVVVGYILMGAGVLALIAAAIQGAGFMSIGRNRMRSERHVSPDGKHVVEETEVR